MATVEIPHTIKPGGDDRTTTAVGSQLPLIRIQPTRGWAAVSLSEVWEYRELLYFLVWRDIKIRYRQTVLGASWAVIQPFFTMLIFTIFFGRLAKIPSEGLPYPLFSYAALVPWTFFSNGVSKGSGSLVSSAMLINKIYMPRVLIPAGAVLSGLLDFAVAFLMLFGMMFYYHISLTANAIWVVPLLLVTLMAVMGLALWLSALNVEYRDVNYIVPFLVQLWLFATPVVYPSSLVPQHWRTLYGTNPMVGVVEGFRWSLLGTGSCPGLLMLMSAAISALLLISGMVYFRRTEKTFADVV